MQTTRVDVLDAQACAEHHGCTVVDAMLPILYICDNIDDCTFCIFVTTKAHQFEAICLSNTDRSMQDI